MKLAAVVLLFALCAAAQVQPRSAPSAQASKATVSGRVVNAVTGEALRKVNVMLVGSGSGQQTQARTAITDDQGAFSFAAVDPASYRIVAVRTGFVRQSYGDRDPGSYVTRASVLTVAPGQEIKDIFIRLQPSAAISGRVVDQDGDPMMHVRVQALRYNYYRGRRQLMPAGGEDSNDRGEYRIYDVTPGRYYLSATYEGGYIAGYLAGVGMDVPDQAYVPVFYPGVNDPSQAAPIEVRPGEEVPGINFTIALQRAVGVSGRVFNSVTGQSGRNVHVALMARSLTMRAFVSGDHDAGTDDQGNFKLRGIAPGSYILTADWDSASQIPGGAPPGREHRRYSARQPIEVGGADVEGLTLTIAPGIDISGTVRIEGTLPPPSASRPEPANTVVMGNTTVRTVISGPLRVALEPLEDVSMNYVGTTVKPDNTFLLENVTEGTYRINVGGIPGNAYLKSARIGGQDVLEDGLVVTRGRRGALELVVSTLTGRLEGTALDLSDKPFPAARVVLVPEGARRNLPAMYRAGVADQFGHFVIAGIPPGDYKLFAWDAIETGAYQDPDFLRSFEDRGQVVRISESGQSTADIKVIISEERGAQ